MSKLTKFVNDYKRAKAQGSTLRPLWQIVLLTPLYFILYLPAKAFVNWIDNK